MNLDYIPLLQVQRDLQAMPRDHERFQEYLRIMTNAHGDLGMLVPLLAANPMAKEHVTAILDAYLALEADTIGADVLAAASARLKDISGTGKVTLVVADDMLGGWTNRYDYEYRLRFQCGGPPATLPHWLNHFWIYGVLWSSETATERAVREALLTAIYRTAYVCAHGPARSLRDMLVQEGAVMTMAGCSGPVLDEEDIAYTRAVIDPFLDANDMRTVVECMFGDAAGQTLGFTPRGLSPWAGIALALHDARPAGCP